MTDPLDTVTPALPTPSPATQATASSAPVAGPYRSFWMGGFEGADHVNEHAEPVDMSAITGHARQLDADYARMARLGLRTARESIGWRISEPGGWRGGFDFSRARQAAQAAAAHGVQPIWTFMHYGTPPDVDMRNERFVDRFVRFAVAAARAVRPAADEAPVYNLINEISFLSWAVGETALMHPYSVGRGNRAGNTRASGYGVKLRLVRAVLRAIDAIRQDDPGARFLHIEPVVHVVAPAESPELATVAAEVRAFQWQVWDLVAGRLGPEIGGRPDALDLIGVNHYHNGQWEVATERRLEWHLRDPRRLRFRALLAETAARYGRPLMVAETSHFGVGRGQWLSEIAGEVQAARDDGVDVQGVCLYPVIDRPDWSDHAHWHHSGLWDVLPPFGADGPLERRLNFAYAKALRRCQRALLCEGAARHGGANA